MWLVWILGGLGVLFSEDCLGSGTGHIFSLLPACWPGQARQSIKFWRLKELDTRLQQLQAQLDRLTQSISSEEECEASGKET